MSPRTQKLAKRYRLDQFDPAVQQRVSKEVYYRPLKFYPPPSAERLSQMVDAILLQQATTPVAFDHGYITLFSPVSSLRPDGNTTGILSNIQRRITAPRLTVV